MSGDKEDMHEIEQIDQEYAIDNTIDLNALIPLGLKLIENNQKQNQAQIRFQKDQLEFYKQRLGNSKSAFKHKYWLLVGITISIIGISVGLIFLKDDIPAGMAILSHVGAVVVGIIAGSGWERLRDKNA